MKRALGCMIFGLLLVAGCSATSVFTVLSNPSGADIYVDGELRGKTPAAIKVTFSENVQMVTEKRILSVKLTGYKDRKEVISPEGNKKFDLMLLPEPPDGAAATEVAGKPSSTTGQTSRAEVKKEAAEPPAPPAVQEPQNAATDEVAAAPAAGVRENSTPGKQERGEVQ